MPFKTTITLFAYLGAASAYAAEIPSFELQLQDHQFSPAEIVIPANTKVKFVVKNLDPTPEEFESHLLHREKVILGNSQAVIYIGPLAPGTYPFVGEFHEATAKGNVVVK
ncbi:MAG: cupredoxin domain-containing protein [Gammaproteobacteria bacterium]|nr:cupredoxin domain-containing protein [Gammaproteobacteria bacterium]